MRHSEVVAVGKVVGTTYVNESAGWQHNAGKHSRRAAKMAYRPGSGRAGQLAGLNRWSLRNRNTRSVSIIVSAVLS